MSVLPGFVVSGLPAIAAGRPPRPVLTPAEQSRGRRVAMLLGAVLLMSLGDLFMTLTHLTQAGMLEANPLARFVMGYNSPALLAAWKLASVGLATGILYWARHRGRTEVATWFCFFVLTWLTCRWVGYNNQIAEFPEVVASASPDWVAMTSDD